VDDYRDWLREQLGPQAEERSHGCDANGWLARPWNLPEHMHPTCWTTDVTLRQIEKRDPTRPVFVWCSHLRPHSPYDPPQFFWDQYIHRELPPVPVGDWADKHDVPIAHPDRWAWQGRLPDALAHRMRAAYMATCTHLDWELGRLMEGLARHRLIQNTCILYTADHGDMMGDHHLHRKTYAYEGSARIPMAIRYPAAFDGPCGTFDPVVGLQDVMPTLLEIAGVDVPPTVTGASMLGAARGGPWREFFHGEHSPCYSAAEAMQYLTDGREKYIYFPTTGEEQLFDLVADRQECHDLARDPSQADRVARWRQRLIDRLGRRGDGFSDGQRLLVRTDHYSAVVGKPPVEM